MGLARAVLFHLVRELLEVLLVIWYLDWLHCVQFLTLRLGGNVEQLALVVHFADHLIVPLHHFYLALLLQLLERLILALKHIA